MRSFLFLSAGVLAITAGCFGANTDDSEESGVSGAGGSSAGSGSGGEARGGRTFGTSGSSSAGSSTGGGSSGASGNAGQGGAVSGGGSGGILCEGDNATIATIDKSCQTTADCIAVHHATDCCGSYTVMGINAGAETSFRAAEMVCAPLPVCDCAPQWTALEDGTQIPYGDTNYVIDCFDGQCQSAYVGTTFACGDISCTEAQYCTLLLGGQPDSGTTPSCSALGDCQSCDCLPASAGCFCSEDDAGNITVTCALP